MLRQLNLLPLLIIPFATLSFVVSHDIVNVSWMEFGERDVPPPIAESFSISSENTGKSYTIHVQLPGDYGQTNAAYPVIYAVAPSPFINGHETILAPLQKRSRVPDFIVVSISPGRRSRAERTGESRGDPTRWHEDLTLGVQTYVNAASIGGKAEAFVAFLEQELIPRIESQYRAAAGRCLAGHGVGGVFVIETAFTRPELFSNYLALAPTAHWADNSTLLLVEEKMRIGFDPDIRVFAAGGSDDTDAYLASFDRLCKALEGPAREQFHIRTELIGGRGHDAMVVPGAQRGLLYLYGN